MMSIQSNLQFPDYQCLEELSTFSYTMSAYILFTVKVSKLANLKASQYTGSRDKLSILVHTKPINGTTH